MCGFLSNRYKLTCPFRWGKKDWLLTLWHHQKHWKNVILKLWPPNPRPTSKTTEVCFCIVGPYWTLSIIYSKAQRCLNPNTKFDFTRMKFSLGKNTNRARDVSIILKKMREKQLQKWDRLVGWGWNYGLLSSNNCILVSSWGSWFMAKLQYTKTTVSRWAISLQSWNCYDEETNRAQNLINCIKWG